MSEKQEPRTFPYPFGPVPGYEDVPATPLTIHVLSESLARIATALEYFMERQKQADAQEAIRVKAENAMMLERMAKG